MLTASGLQHDGRGITAVLNRITPDQLQSLPRQKKCGEAGLIFGKLYSRMRRACSRRGKGPAGESLRRLDGVWNAWSDCYRRCAGRCIGDEARILSAFAHGSDARGERAVTAFLCATQHA